MPHMSAPYPFKPLIFSGLLDPEPLVPSLECASSALKYQTRPPGSCQVFYVDAGYLKSEECKQRQKKKMHKCVSYAIPVQILQIVTVLETIQLES